MYINFHKFNYATIPKNEFMRYEERDKKAYKKIINEWVNSNINDFVQRKWEIQEIHYIKELGDFIKLVREAESLYELGFYTSCTALVGVASEDFSKYLSLNNNKNRHIDKTQFNRLKLQLDEQIITSETYNLLDDIRKIRNDCLHYNENFKLKSNDELKIDALKVLNNLKLVLQKNIGTTPNVNDFFRLVEELIQSENHRNFEEIIWKQKNMFSHLFPMNTVQDPNVKQVIKKQFFIVEDLDDEEITLTDFEETPELGIKLSVIVDINEKGKELISSNSIQIDDLVFAEVYSDVAYDGQTREWYLRDMVKAK